MTIFAGGNDTNGIVNAAACLTLGGPIAAASRDVPHERDRAIRLGIPAARRSPSTPRRRSAKIVVANLPNFAGIPFAQTPQVAPVKPLLQAVSVGIDTNVYQPAFALGVPVVDLLCNPSSYNPANFYTDGFHPNDAGYAALAQAFVAQIQAAKPTPPADQLFVYESRLGAAAGVTTGVPNLNRR